MSEESRKNIIKILNNIQSLKIDAIASKALIRNGITFQDAPDVWLAIA